MMVLACGVFLSMSHAEDIPPKLVADMETKPNYGIHKPNREPQVRISGITASQGGRSLRFEYEGEGQDRAGVTFPVDGAEGYNAVAFDMYCEQDNGSSLILSVRQRVEEKGKAARYKGSVNLGACIDGWTSMCLVKDASLVFRQEGGVEPDWSKMSSVSFSMAGDMKGKGVFYLDNIRFASVSGGRSAKTANLIYNSSFEIATNPDVPDGWTRDLGVPPYGPDVWGVDESTAYGGRKSLRIGLKGKSARSWGRHTTVIQGRDYTGSVFLKGDRDGVVVKLALAGIGRKVVNVTTNWQRYSVGGQAGESKRNQTTLRVELLSEGALWVDAAQLELGTNTTPYAPSAADALEEGQRVSRPATPAGVIASELTVPEVTVKRVKEPPRIDGDLSDRCWQGAQEMAPFVKVSENELARRRTVARMCYDRNALYVAVRADEPDIKAVVDQLEQAKRAPWGGDLIEIFIDLNHDRNTCYHFAANAKGDTWNARYAMRKTFAGAPGSWHCEWNAEGQIGKDYWTVEAEIPFTCFDLRDVDRTIHAVGINICREDPRNKEHSSWAFSYGSFRNPESFGTVKGLNLDLRPFLFEVADLRWERGQARAVLANHSGNNERLDVAFIAEGPDGRHTAAALGVSRADSELCVESRMPLIADGFYNLFVRASDESGLARLVSQPIELRVSGADVLDLVGTEFDFYTDEEEARVRCFIEAGKERCAGLRLRWWLERDGKQVTKPAELKPRPWINEWSVRIADLSNGEYVIKSELGERAKTVAEGQREFRKLSPGKHEVRINRWGRFLVCDGEPFFWYGFYHGFRAGNEEWTAALDEMKSAHCTTVLNYLLREGLDNVGWMLDRAQEREMKLWIHLGWMLSYWIPKYENSAGRYASEEEAIAHLTEVVTKNREHPALLGWCSLDEPGNRPHLFTTEYTERYYRLIKKADPYHPCIFSHLTRLGEVDIYGSSTDMALMPFVARGGRYERLFWEFWDAGFAIACNAPCFGALGGARREPTPEEQRIRMYKAIVSGARGLSSYTFRCASMGTWREFQRVGKELETLAPILLTPDDRLRVDVSPGTGDISAVLKEYRNTHYLLAVNTAPYPAEAAFRMLDLKKMEQAVPMFGSRPARLDSETRTLSTEMAATSTAVYEIK